MSSSSASPAGKRLRIERANLYYKTAEIDTWTRLPSTSRVPDYNVSNVDFLWSITIRQRYPGGTGICDLSFKPEHYSQQPVKIEMDMESKNLDQADFLLEFKCQKVPNCTFSRTAPDHVGPRYEPKDFPLAQLAPQFTEVKLKLPQDDFRPRSTQGDLRTQLSVLTSGDVTRIEETEEKKAVGDLMAGQLAEDVAQGEQMKTHEGSSIRTLPRGHLIWLKIWPNSLPDKNDIDIDKKSMGLRYMIRESTLFPEDDIVLKKHPILGNYGARGWQITLREKPTGWEAPIAATLDNFVASDTYKRFIGEDQGVILEPLFNNVGGERGRAALKEFGAELDREHKLALGFIARGSKLSKLPVRQLIMPGENFTQVDNEASTTADEPVPDRLRQELNVAQSNAIQMAMTKRLSLIWGPAGTGKSVTLAQLIYRLIEAPRKDRSQENIIVSAPTNVAVDQIRERATRVFSSQTKEGQSPMGFVRVYSEAEIRAQYIQKNARKLQDHQHIDSKRLAIALRTPDKYQGYLKGRQELMQWGCLPSQNAEENYSKSRNELTQLVMDGARVVFCTLDSLRTPAMYRKKFTKDAKGETVEEVFCWPATTCIVDEAGCARTLQILLAIMSFKWLERLVLAGDHKQLQAFVLSDEAKKLWTGSFFKDCYDKKLSCTQLNVQYRAHLELFAAANKVVYENAVSSAYEIPRPWLSDLLSKMPIRFSVAQKQYALTTYSNFINIAHAVHTSRLNGSSCNDAEVEAVNALVLALLAQGKTPNSIAVITGYLWQLERLKDTAKQNGWANVPILTVDTSQGDEYEAIIISLVKTSGNPGSIGDLRRANVAVTRAKEAMYFVGNWSFWGQRPQRTRSGFEEMHALLQHMLYQRPEGGFVVHSIATALDSNLPVPSFIAPATTAATKPPSTVSLPKLDHSATAGRKAVLTEELAVSRQGAKEFIEQMQELKVNRLNNLARDLEDKVARACEDNEEEVEIEVAALEAALAVKIAALRKGLEAKNAAKKIELGRAAGEQRKSIEDDTERDIASVEAQTRKDQARIQAEIDA